MGWDKLWSLPGLYSLIFQKGYTQAMRYAIAALIAATLLTGAGLEGQNLFALPGPTSNSNTVLVYVADPFLSVTNFMSGVGSFQVVGKPDGSKFYVFSSTTTNSLTSVDSTFQNPKF